MTYHTTTHPIRRFFGIRGLGAIDRPASNPGSFVTSLTPYDVSAVQANYVPSSVETALTAAGLYGRSGWSDAGHVWVIFNPIRTMTDAERHDALTSAIHAAERSIGGGAKLLLPGEVAPSGSIPTTAPPGTQMSTPDTGAPLTTSSNATALSALMVQQFLYNKGFDVTADNVFGTKTKTALDAALARVGASSDYAVSSDKRMVTLPISSWVALARLPTVRRPSAMPPVTPGTDVTDMTAVPGAGPDWGLILPWIFGGIAVGGIGWYVYRKKHPRVKTKYTVRNPDRFRIFDAGPGTGDRYTIVDSKPNSYKDRPFIKWIDYFGFNEYPFSPQGIGMHGEMSMDQWGEHARAKFKTLGKRIYLSDLTGEARKAAEQFMRERGASKGSKRSAAKARKKSPGRRGPLGALHPASCRCGYCHRVSGNPSWNFDDIIINVNEHPAGLSWIESRSGYRGDDLVFEDSDEFHTEEEALSDAVSFAKMLLDDGVSTALVIDNDGNEYWSGSRRGKRVRKNGRSYVVRYFIESRSPSGGVTRDAWLDRWGSPNKTKLRELLRRDVGDVAYARVVDPGGTVVIPWIARSA